MGGAAGHMAHPFDLPAVRNGKDLIKFFDEASEYLADNESSVKIDGVNVSFKLVDGPRVRRARNVRRPDNVPKYGVCLR